ncbi:MAG TPA: hypothetical protein VKU44_01255, partial [Terriglobia bacterium]|nr:hypothetical protein [Terriglobia bacterium]
MRGLLVTSMCILLAATPGIAAQQPGSEGSQVSALGLRAPAAGRPTRIDPSGETVLPNGRLVTPRGKQVKVAPHPYGLALSPDGKTVVTANSGTAPFSVSIVTDLASAEPKVAQIPPGVKPAEGELDSVFMGVAIAPDNRTLYVAEGDNGCVGIFDLVTHERLGRVSLDGAFQGKSYAHSLSGELKLSPDGHSLYVLDLAHFRLVVVDTAAKQIVASVAVGRLPFALALSPDGKRAYASNVGMFQYSLVPGVPVAAAGEASSEAAAKMESEVSKNKSGLDFPAFGFPSKEAERGTVVGGKQIAGLGDPNVPESNSVWVIDVSSPTAPQVTARIRTGLPVGEQSVGGSSPGGVVAGRKQVFVSNTSQDSISIIDARTNQVKQTITLEPAAPVAGLRGVLPFGLALSPDEKRLYVACAGINAVAVFDPSEGRVLGYIPAGWFPARVAISSDGGTLYVANAKGFGAGPNGGANFHLGPEGTYIGDITKGTISVIPVPISMSFIIDREIPTGAYSPAFAADTEQVLKNNGFAPSAGSTPPRSTDFPVPPPGAAASKIHHVVYIVKENRTFDQVFGDLTQVGADKVEADPSLLEFGEDSRATNKDTGQSVEHAR